MSKVILILNKMPEKCCKCPCRYIDNLGDACCKAKRKFIDDGFGGPPDWCPLVPLPEKPVYPPLNECSYVAGWNACIDAITAKKKQPEQPGCLKKRGSM